MKKGIFHRMKEILPMWRMCRLLKDRRGEWLTAQAMARIVDENSHMIRAIHGTPHGDAFLNTQIATDAILGKGPQEGLGVLEGYLLSAYREKYICKGETKKIGVSKGTDFSLQLNDARAVLNQCLTHGPSFIDREDKHICLNSDGERFAADRFELFKEYLQTIGPVWTFVTGGGILTALFYVLKYLVFFLKDLMVEWTNVGG